MHFDDTLELDQTNMPHQYYEPADPTQRAPDVGFNIYARQGYLQLQNWIANEVLRETSGDLGATIAMQIIPANNIEYVDDDFQQVLEGMLSFFMLLMYILPIYRCLDRIVSEKGSRIRESMRMMGLSDTAFWLTWFTYYIIVTTIITLLVCIILSFRALKYSNFGVIFIFFWLYGFSLFGFIVFMS